MYARTLGYSTDEPGVGLVLFAIVVRADIRDQTFFHFFEKYKEISAQCNFGLTESTGDFCILGLRKTRNFPPDQTIVEIPKADTSKLLADSIFTLNVEVGPYAIDIYSVCASAHVRGTKIVYESVMQTKETVGMSQVLFNFAIDVLRSRYPGAHMSLGIVFENPSFDAALKVYARAGFGNPTASLTLNYNKSEYAYPFLRMDLLDRTSARIQQNTVADAERLRKAFDKTIFRKYVTEIVLTRELHMYMDSLLNDAVENGMAFVLVPNAPAHSPNSQRRYTLAMVCDSLNKGTAENVQMPSTPIFAHTHTRAVTAKYNSLNGWPSSLDQMVYLSAAMQYSAVNYPLLTIVASDEGYYTYQPTHLLHTILRSTASGSYFNKTLVLTRVYTHFIFNWTYFYYTLSNAFREHRFASFYSLYDYISRTNQLSINKMLETLLDFMEVIANMTHMRKELHKASQGYLFKDKLPSAQNACLTDIPALLNIFFSPDERTFTSSLNSYIQKAREPGELVDLVLQSCKADNIDVHMPLTIQTLNSTFAVNPSAQNTFLYFFNYGQDTGMLSLSDVATLRGNYNLQSALSDLPSMYSGLKKHIEIGGSVSQTQYCDPTLSGTADLHLLY